MQFLGLEKDFHAVEHEDLTLAGLPNLVGIKQLELSCSFVVVVLDADAASPFLDLAFGGPETDVNWVGSVKNQSGCGYVY